MTEPVHGYLNVKQWSLLACFKNIKCVYVVCLYNINNICWVAAVVHSNTCWRKRYVIQSIW